MEPDYEEDHKLGPDFEYLGPLVENVVRGDSGTTEAEQDEAGGQSQESERMEIE